MVVPQHIVGGRCAGTIFGGICAIGWLQREHRRGRRRVGLR